MELNLPKDIEEAEELAGAVLIRDQLAVHGAGQRLNAAPGLVAHRQPAPRTAHRLFIKNAKMQMNIYTQMPKPTMVRAPNFFAALDVKQAERQAQNLHQQQRQHHACGIQPQVGAIGGCHADDGVHAVNIEEIRKNIDQHRLVGNDLLDGGTNALNAAGNIALFIRLARGLLAVFSAAAS